MKTSLLVSRLALVLTLAPALSGATARAQSTAATAQEAAVRAQVESARTQVAASEASAQAVIESQKARIEETKARIEVERAALAARTAVRVSTEPVTFLGVMTAPAPSALTTQLGRPAGMGLVVVSVQPKSPAEGLLKTDDLLLRLDDQKLINNDQLTALIRGYQEGDQVTLTYVRGGNEATATVKLAKQEAARLGKPFILSLAKVAGSGNENVNFKLQDADDWKIGSTIHVSTTADIGGLNQTFTYTHGIGGSTTEIKIVDGKKTVTTRNSTGDIEFSGPFDTEEERKAAPASVQTRVADVERRIGRLQVLVPAKGGATIRPVGSSRIEVQLPGEQPVKAAR